ncbi:MAG: hypothetical protein ACP5E4_00270 [Candidatus Aenigmatarchaeota archaeon]
MANSCRIDLFVYTNDKGLVFYLIGGSTLSHKDSVRVAGSANLIYRGSVGHTTAGMPEIAKFTLKLDESPDIPEISAWLCEKLQGRTEKLLIGGKPVLLNRDTIAQVIGKHARVHEA